MPQLVIPGLPVLAQGPLPVGLVACLHHIDEGLHVLPPGQPGHADLGPLLVLRDLLHDPQGPAQVKKSKAAGIGANILFISPEKLAKKTITDENRPDYIVHRFIDILDLPILQ